MHSQYNRCLLNLMTVCSFCLPMAAQDTTPAAPAESPMVIKITTHEVVIDVLARDRHNNPVTDLAETELQVLEVGKHREKELHRILSVRIIDPHRDGSRAGSTDSGFRISSGAICALNSTTHYELAVQASLEPGFHQVLVKTTRPGVTLSFRHHYYVGPVADDSRPADRRANGDSLALREAACFHPLTPATLAITAHPLESPGAKSARYSVIVRPETLAAIGLSGSNTRIQLDLGMCTFDATGAIVEYLHSSVDRQLKPEELERVQSQGLANLVEIPSEPPHLARFAVLDRGTGNLGIVDAARLVSLTVQADRSAALPRPTGSVRSFGVVTPREYTFCGDVYELSSGASELPDFWNMDPVGSIFTDMLKVEDQDINLAEGIPGVTRNNTWFAIDYHGEFFVTKPGEYAFELESDDGSKLEIDNKQLIDLDGVHSALVKTAHLTLSAGLHTIHVPYFQGPPESLALILRIKPPGESMRVFNITEFAPPRTTP